MATTDFLVLYDGGSSTSAMLGNYCGDSIPPSHVSSSNEVLVNFQSDGSSTRAGFKMEYNPIGNKSIQNNTEYYGEYFKELWEHSLFPNVFLSLLKLLVICHVVLFLSCLTFENSEVPYL